MKIVVTGGAGFIGSALVRHLVAAGHAVTTFDKLAYAGCVDRLEDVAGSSLHHFHQLDLLDITALGERLFSACPDAVVHLAAESHVDRSIAGPAQFVQSNIVGTFNLLEASRAYWTELDAQAQRQFRFIHVSTDEVFGALDAGDPPFDLASAYAPRSPYAASKAGADHLVRAWGTTYGLPVVVSHCSNNYGPFQFPEKLIPRVISRALRGETIPVYGQGEQVRDWMHVSDHIEALVLMLSRAKPGATYLLGGQQEKRNIDLVWQLCELIDDLAPGAVSARDLVRFVDDRPGHDFRYAVDASRARAELGWAPRKGFDAGLRETVAWYVENKRWWMSALDREAS